METAAVRDSLISLPDFFSLFLGYSYSFFQESLQGISEETCRKFLALGFMTTYAPLLHLSESVEVNGMKWCHEALTEHACPVSVCSFSFLPCKLRNRAMLHYTLRSYVRTTKNGQCLLHGGLNVFPRNLEFLHVGGHRVTAEIILLL